MVGLAGPDSPSFVGGCCTRQIVLLATLFACLSTAARHPGTYQDIEAMEPLLEEFEKLLLGGDELDEGERS